MLLWLLGLMDGVFSWLLTVSQAVLPTGADASIERLRKVPGLGVLVMALMLLATGVFVTNIFGQWWVRQWDRALGRIPIVKSIYSSVKQVSDTLFSSSGNAFREAVLVQYPHQGSWTIGFVTGTPGGEVASQLSGEHVSLYVPTTPNPTSGFFLMMPRTAVRPLAMSVDEALKYIISMGVVVPPPPMPPAPLPAAANGQWPGRKAPLAEAVLRADPPPRLRHHRLESTNPAWPPALCGARPLYTPNTRSTGLHRDAYHLLRPGQRSADGPDRHPHGLGPSPPRPWRRDLHRPA